MCKLSSFLFPVFCFLSIKNCKPYHCAKTKGNENLKKCAAGQRESLTEQNVIQHLFLMLPKQCTYFYVLPHRWCCLDFHSIKIFLNEMKFSLLLYAATGNQTQGTCCTFERDFNSGRGKWPQQSLFAQNSEMKRNETNWGSAKP